MDAGLAWAEPAFFQFMRHFQETNQVLEVCRAGILHVTDFPQLVRILADLDGLTKTKREQMESISAARLPAAQFARRQVSRGFPILHAHAIVSLWGALEVLVHDLAIAWLVSNPDTLMREPFLRIRIALGEFERLGKRQRMEFAIKEVSRSLNADLKIGVGRFETILETVGFAGPIAHDLRRTLMEASQVRNVLVHRGGLVDRRLKESCPWLKIRLGARVRTDRATYARYSRVMFEYAWTLLNRCRVRAKLPTVAMAEAIAQHATISWIDPRPARDR
jgi:hypothetical protein